MNDEALVLAWRHELEHDGRRRRNGGPTPPAAYRVAPPARRAPEPRWIMAGLAVAASLFAVVVLGVWKLVELVSRAL